MLISVDLDLHNPFVPTISCKIYSIRVDVIMDIITLVLDISSNFYPDFVQFEKQGRIISVRSYHPYHEGKEV